MLWEDITTLIPFNKLKVLQNLFLIKEVAETVLETWLFIFVSVIFVNNTIL